MGSTLTPRKIIEDDKAFAAERRSEFGQSPAYLEALQNDFEEWKKSNGQEVSYDEWYAQYRKPYKRVLFKVGDRWQTLESILHVRRFRKVDTPHLVARYHFAIPINGPTNAEAVMRYGKLRTEVQRLTKKGGGKMLGDGFFVDAGRVLHGSILTSADIGPLLEKAGLEYEVEAMPTRVGVKRTPSSFDLPEDTE